MNSLKGHAESIRSICFSPDGQFFMSAGFDGGIRVWEATRGKYIKNITGHSGWIRSISCSSDGNFIASSGDDQTVRVWDIKSDQCIRFFKDMHICFYHWMWIQEVNSLSVEAITRIFTFGILTPEKSKRF